LHFDAFADDLDEVVERATVAGLRGVITADYDESTRERAKALVETYRGAWRTIGLHPWAVLDQADAEKVSAALDQVENDVAASEDMCAIGELGMDWYRDGSREFAELQRTAFRRQLSLAREMNLPIVIHSVRSHEDVLKILADDGVPDAGGIIHGFQGSAPQARRFLDMDIDLSIGTTLVRGGSEKLSKVLADVPRDRVHVETDCPSRPPDAVSTERNEPAFLTHVIARLAEVWDTDEEEVAAWTESNTRRRFALSDEVLEPREEGKER